MPIIKIEQYNQGKQKNNDEVTYQELLDYLKSLPEDKLKEPINSYVLEVGITEFLREN